MSLTIDKLCMVEWKEKSLKIPKGNQNSYIEEEHTTQWPKEKVQKDKQAPEYRINCEIYTPYAGAAGMFLHINGKFSMGKLKSSLLSQSVSSYPSFAVNLEV